MHQKKIDAQPIRAIVEKSVLALLPEKMRGSFSSSIPLSDLGFGLLELTLLKDDLSKVFKHDLHSTFLSRYNTAELIADYFIENQKNEYRDWLYNVEWVEIPVPLLPKLETISKGVWLIFSDECGFSNALIRKLNSYGFECVEVKYGQEFDSSSPRKFTVRPNEIEDFDKLLSSEAFSNGITATAYLWGLFKDLPQVPSLDLLQKLHRRGCGGLLNLVKSLIKHCNSSLPHLFVSSWSIQEEGDSMGLAQWPLAGLCKAISMEHPDFKLRQISLNIMESREQSGDNLFLEFFANDKEDQIFWRGEKRLAPRLIRFELPEVAIPKFRKDGTYLITGALSGLGLGLTRWYVERGAGSLVLLDYSKETPEAKEIIQELKGEGISIRIYENFDISNTDKVSSMLQEIKQELPPLKGLMHLSGLIDDDLLINLNWSRFQPIFDIKIGGAWNLHLLTLEEKLDHFILFSSIGSTLGPLWRSNRNAANAFLDALAHYRKGLKLPSLTINWAPWGHEGMAVKTHVETTIPEGLKPLTVEDGINVLDHILELSIPEVVVAPIDWRKLLGRFSFEKPLLSNMSREAGLRGPEMLEQFQSARAEERRQIIQKFLEALIRRILLLSPITQLDKNKSFSEMGLDERTLLYLKNQLQYDLTDSIELPFVIINKNLSIHNLTEVLYPVIEAAVLKSKQSEYHKLFGNHAGKVALITGGSRGIGERVSRILIYAGASISILARNFEQLQNLRQNLIIELKNNGDAQPENRVYVQACDIGQKEQINTSFSNTLAHFGRIDYLVNNSGVSGEEQLIVDMSVKGWTLTLEANLNSNYDLMIKSLPYMKNQQSGHIVNVSSELGGMRHATPAYPNRADYAVSKAGNRALAENFAAILGPEVQITAIAPGPVQGERLEGRDSSPGLYMRRAKVNLENKRVNSLYNALVKISQNKTNIIPILSCLSNNVFKNILSQKNLPPEIHSIIQSMNTQSMTKGSCSETHLFTEEMALRLLKRLKGSSCIPENYSEKDYFQNFSSCSDTSFFSQLQLNDAAHKIKTRIMDAIALAYMPREEDVAKEVVLALSNKYITGETVYPSCGLSLARLSTSGDFTGHFYPVLYDSLQAENVLIIGNSMFDEIILMIEAYRHAKNIKNIVVALESEVAKNLIQNHLDTLEIDKRTIFLRVSKLGDSAQNTLDSLFKEFGLPEIIISVPCGELPKQEGGWEKLPTIKDFRQLINEQITHHFHIVKRAALITNCKTFLITPKLSESQSQIELIFARFIQNTLASLTITVGEESARLMHQAVFYQLDMNLDFQNPDYKEKLIDALLLLSLPSEKINTPSQGLHRLGYLFKI